MTDRDLVTRCMATDQPAAGTPVCRVMTSRVISVPPDMDAALAAHLMGRQKIRRLPVVEDGKICGILSLADMAAREESILDAADALADITAGF